MPPCAKKLHFVPLFSWPILLGFLFFLSKMSMIFWWLDHFLHVVVPYWTGSTTCQSGIAKTNPVSSLLGFLYFYSFLVVMYYVEKRAILKQISNHHGNGCWVNLYLLVTFLSMCFTYMYWPIDNLFVAFVNFPTEFANCEIKLRNFYRQFLCIIKLFNIKRNS